MRPAFRPSHQRGTALLVVMALLGIMCVLMVATAQSIFFVKRELKLIEKKQLQHWEKTSTTTGGPKRS